MIKHPYMRGKRKKILLCLLLCLIALVIGNRIFSVRTTGSVNNNTPPQREPVPPPPNVYPVEPQRQRQRQRTTLWTSFPLISFFRKWSHWKSPKILISLVLCLLIVFGASAYAFQQLVLKNALPNVELYRVGNMQNVSLAVGGGGIASPLQSVNILYPLSERVVSVMVKEGDHVAPNQPLIRLDASLLNADISQAADDMAAAQDYLNSVSISGNAVTIAQAQQEYDTARNKYKALLTQSSSPLLRGDKLVSPIGGVITQVNVNPGEMFQANNSLLTVIDTSTVVVHAKLPLSNLNMVHVGQAASVTPSALPNQQFNGTISTIIPVADPQTDTFEVWVSIPSKNMPKDSALLPGMSAFVRVQSPATALVVPRLAVLNPDGDAAVYVVQNHVAHLQHVQVIGRSVESIFINGGLSPATPIVLVGLDQLHDNQKVHITSTE
jgi:membrane fusion protein (multidrug efflux system)